MCTAHTKSALGTFLFCPVDGGGVKEEFDPYKKPGSQNYPLPTKQSDIAGDEGWESGDEEDGDEEDGDDPEDIEEVPAVRSGRNRETSRPAPRSGMVMRLQDNSQPKGKSPAAKTERAQPVKNGQPGRSTALARVVGLLALGSCRLLV